MGQEIDKFIAEKFLGWTDIHFDNRGNLYAKIGAEDGCRTSTNGRFSERASDAIALLYEIEKKGYHFCLYNYGGAYQCDIGKDHADATTSTAMPQDTIAMAISMAIVEWVKNAQKKGE